MLVVKPDENLQPLRAHRLRPVVPAESASRFAVPRMGPPCPAPPQKPPESRLAPARQSGAVTGAAPKLVRSGSVTSAEWSRSPKGTRSRRRRHVAGSVRWTLPGSASERSWRASAVSWENTPACSLHSQRTTRSSWSEVGSWTKRWTRPASAHHLLVPEVCEQLWREAGVSRLLCREIAGLRLGDIVQGVPVRCPGSRPRLSRHRARTLSKAFVVCKLPSASTMPRGAVFAHDSLADARRWRGTASEGREALALLRCPVER